MFHTKWCLRYPNACALLALTLVISIGSQAQEPDSKPSADAIAAFLEGDKNTLRKIAAEYASRNIDILDISYLEPEDSNNSGGFTAAYKWNAESSDQWVGVTDGRFAMRRTSYGIDIDGKYAFSDTPNNNDLSTVSASFSLERGDFGRLTPIAAADSDAFQDCLVHLQERFPQPSNGSDEEWKKYRADTGDANNACWADHGIDDVVKANDAAYVYGIDFHAALEGDQNYDNRNTVFGLSGVLAMQSSSETQKWNVFDFTFRLLRNGFDRERNYVAPWPSVKIDVDRVDGSDNDNRTALTSESTFTRAAAEVAFQTIVASIEGQPIRFNIAYRYFSEFSAPTEIKAADLDSFDYLAMSLRFPARMIPFFETDDYEFFFSYTTGQLPFDLVSEKAYEIGIGTNISQLARLFAE